MDWRGVLPPDGEDCLERPNAGVALGGFMGTGKSAVGVRLAKCLAVPFVDMDVELTDRYGPISDQFARDGETVFRSRESALVRELADGVRRVVATGGGVWAERENREVLARYYRTVVLTAPLSVLRARIGTDPSRPLWDEDVAERFLARQAAYADAEILIEVATLGVEEVVQAILRQVA